MPGTRSQGYPLKAESLLRENRAALDKLAKHLYEKETITGDEFMAILSA